MSARIILRHLQQLRAGFDEAGYLSSATALAAESLVKPPANADVPWMPPQVSIGSRRPSLRSRGSVRGALVDESANLEIVFESRLERGMAEMLLVRRDVEQIIDQPAPVRYVDAAGRLRSHTFDFLVVMVDRRRIAIAVKPVAKVACSGIKETLTQIRQQVGISFADLYLLRTDRHITRDRVHNARLMLRSRRSISEDDVSAVKAVVGSLAGAFKIADVVTAAGLGARGFNALLALVADGWLIPQAPGKIDYATQVRRVWMEDAR